MKQAMVTYAKLEARTFYSFFGLLELNISTWDLFRLILIVFVFVFNAYPRLTYIRFNAFNVQPYSAFSDIMRQRSSLISKVKGKA